MTHQDNLAAVRAACLLARAPKGAVEATSNKYDPEIGHVLLALGEGYALDGKGELMRQTWREPCSFDTKFLEIRLDLRANLSGWSKEAVAALAALLKRDD